MKKIVLITTGQPSSNPRIVKEATTFQEAGFEVTVLYCFFVQWATEKDTLLFKTISWKHVLAGGSPTEKKWLYLFTRGRSKLISRLHGFFGNRFLLAERRQVRAFDELLKEAKKIKADWYIGHNLGALAVAVKAARFNNAKAGFDFEDYHRGEGSAAKEKDLQRIIYLENNYLQALTYYSTASTMITAITKKNHPTFSKPVITLLNCFPLNEQPVFKEKAATDATLQLFWFSQTIGIDRGLEILIRVLGNLKDPSIHLTLAGKCEDSLLKYIAENAGTMTGNIHFAGIIEPAALPAFAAGFDVGMAIELSVPENRNICLTNKIFTYLLAGNAMILSPTAMQVAFNEAYKVGDLFLLNDETSLAEKILGYKDLPKLNAQKKYNYGLAKTQLNWEKEAQKLIAVIV